MATSRDCIRCTVPGHYGGAEELLAPELVARRTCLDRDNRNNRRRHVSVHDALLKQPRAESNRLGRLVQRDDAGVDARLHGGLHSGDRYLYQLGLLGDARQGNARNGGERRARLLARDDTSRITMKVLLLFIFWFAAGLISLFLAILLGERGSWYFAWVLGTAMIVLLSVAGTMFLDVQEARERDRRQAHDRRKQ